MGTAVAVLAPLVFVAAASVVLLVSTIVSQPHDPGPIPAVVYDALPDAVTHRVSGTQLFAGLFAAFGLYAIVSALRRRSGLARAELTVDADGLLMVRERGTTQQVHLRRLVSVDATTNTRVLRTYRQVGFQPRQETTTPVGSWTLLRLTDETGTTVTLNPGAWEDGQQLAEIVRHAVWHGDAPVTPAAAAAYGLPERAARR